MKNFYIKQTKDSYVKTLSYYMGKKKNIKGHKIKIVQMYYRDLYKYPHIDTNVKHMPDNISFSTI